MKTRIEGAFSWRGFSRSRLLGVFGRGVEEGSDKRVRPGDIGGSEA